MPRRPKKHPGGRPPVTGETRSARLGPVHVTTDEHARAKRLAAEHGLSLADWVRRRVLHAGADEK